MLHRCLHSLLNRVINLAISFSLIAAWFPAHSKYLLHPSSLSRVAAKSGFQHKSHLNNVDILPPQSSLVGCETSRLDQFPVEAVGN